MNLDMLQKDGAIQIGVKSSRIVLYAYCLADQTDVVSVGWTSKGAVVTEDGPIISDVVKAYAVPVRFLMICHHSSAREIVGKIREGLTSKGMTAEPPSEATGKSHEHWFKAKLEDIVYAYPPFAKIFLSEVPSFAPSETSVLSDTPDDEVSDGSRATYRQGRKGDAPSPSDVTDEGETRAMADALLLRTKGSRNVASLLMIGVIIAGTAFLGLNKVNNTQAGRALIGHVEDFTGLSFGGDDGWTFGGVPDDFRQATLTGNTFEGSFVEWYDPTRSDDAGRTFGMPKDVSGFKIRTWVEGVGDDQKLYAAYRYTPVSTWTPSTPQEATASRKMMIDLLRIPQVSSGLHADACEVRQSSYEAFDSVDIVVVHDADVLSSFHVDDESCERGYPFMLPASANSSSAQPQK